MTGEEEDGRNPRHFQNLINLIKKNDLEDTFIFLGLVPYSDVNSLMLHSIAVINPSYFEGWSTTVEESKSLGVHLILSDLPVHREQAEDLAEFFPPNKPSHLALLLASNFDRALKENPATNINVFSEDDINNKLNLYGHQYQRIVLDLFDESKI